MPENLSVVMKRKCSAKKGKVTMFATGNKQLIFLGL